MPRDRVTTELQTGDPATPAVAPAGEKPAELPVAPDLSEASPTLQRNQPVFHVELVCHSAFHAAVFDRTPQCVVRRVPQHNVQREATALRQTPERGDSASTVIG
jgi:hypothetical protein